MAEQAPDRPPRILVVDDDPRIVAAVRRALVYEGWEVQTAGDGPATASTRPC